MTTEVSKYSVYDPRVIQTKPKYAVEKGALSITNVSFNAQTANNSTQQFNVIVPSENVFIDRAVDWISSGVVSIAVNFLSAPATGNIIMGPGDVALAAFPSHQCVQQMTATINDATVTVNTADVLNYVLRLQDLAQHRLRPPERHAIDGRRIEQRDAAFQSRFNQDLSGLGRALQPPHAKGEREAGKAAFAEGDRQGAHGKRAFASELALAYPAPRALASRASGSG